MPIKKQFRVNKTAIIEAGGNASRGYYKGE